MSGLGKDPTTIPVRKPQAKTSQPDPTEPLTIKSKAQLINIMKKHENYIVKIQSLYRGHMSR